VVGLAVGIDTARDSRAVSADSRAELFGRPLSSLTATWFRTSPVL